MRDLQADLFGVFDPEGDDDALRRAFDAMAEASRRRHPEIDAQTVAAGDGRVIARLGRAGRGGSGARRRPGIRFRSGGRKGVVAGRALLFARHPTAEAWAEDRGAEASAGPSPDDADDGLRLARFWSEGGFAADVAGPSPVEGEFAAALLDLDRRALTLARDPAGVEAMYWVELGGGAVAFSTTPHALLALPQAPAEPDVEALRLNAFVSCEMPWRSYWRGVHMVAAGGAVAATSAGVARRRWWRPARDESLAGLAPDRFLGAFAERLATCVGDRWSAEPTAQALLYSGGLDSSMILAAAAAAAAAPDDDLRVVSVTSGLARGAEDRRLQALARRRFPTLRATEVSAEGLDPLTGAEAVWRQAAAPNVDPFICANLAMADALRAAGLSGGHGGFGGDFVVSSPSTAVFSEALGAFRLAEAARIFSAFSRAKASRRKLLVESLPAAWRATRPLARGERLRDRPAAPFRTPDPEQFVAWAAAGVQWPAPPAATLREDHRAMLAMSSGQWPMRMTLPGTEASGARTLSISATMLDTRLTSAAMAAPIELSVFRGRTRGLARATLAQLGFEDAALRDRKSDLAPEVWRTAAAGLAARRETLRAFQDFPLWRETIDQGVVDALMAEAGSLTDRAKTYALLRAWFFGEFLRLASEAR